MNEPTPTHTFEESMIWRNGRNNGIHEERDRIVKLLEDMYHNKGEDGNCIYTKHFPECCNCDLIALIKGENTDKANVHTSADNAITDTQGENK